MRGCLLQPAGFPPKPHRSHSTLIPRVASGWQAMQGRTGRRCQAQWRLVSPTVIVDLSYISCALQMERHLQGPLSEASQILCDTDRDMLRGVKPLQSAVDAGRVRQLSTLMHDARSTTSQANPDEMEPINCMPDLRTLCEIVTVLTCSKEQKQCRMSFECTFCTFAA